LERYHHQIADVSGRMAAAGLLGGFLIGRRKKA
jgi:hypothetical protein